MALDDYTIDTSGTAQDVQRRQKMADALLQHGMDTSAAAGGKNGGWLTALNRGLAGALGGYQTAQANQLDQANRQSGQDASNAYVKSLTGQNPATQGSVPASLSAAQPPTADAAASGIAPKEGMDPEGKPYTQDQLNPMDEPRGDARKKMIATMLSEEKPGSPEGLGVANVIRNRAVDGGWGNTPDAVVQSPNQFSAWNGPGGQAKVMANLLNPGAVAKANDQVDQAYGVGKYASAGPNDPTEGKTYFYDPQSMSPPNSVPKWAQGKQGQQIGKTMFFDDPNDNSQTPPNAQMAQGQLPNQQQVMSAAGQPAPDVNAQRKAMAAQVLMNPYAPASIKKLAQDDLERMQKQDSFTQETDKEGNIWSVNKTTGQRVIAKAAEKDPASRQEYDSYASDEKSAGRQPISYGQFLNKNGTAGAAGDDNSTLVGDEFLKTLPRGEADIVKKIAEYDIDPKSLSTKGGHREDLLKKVSQYDADYSEPLYASRKAAIKEFGAGGPNSPAGQITAGNTAILHAGEMSDALEKLKKTNSGVLGSVGQAGIPYASYYAQKAHNAGLVGTGTEEAKAQSEFETSKNHFSEEVAKFYGGAAGSEAQRARALANLDQAKSLPELQAAIQEEARLMKGKISTLQDRISTAMGPSAWKRAMKEAGGQFPIVQQQSADQLAKIEKRAAGGASPSAPSAGTVQDGYRFKGGNPADQNSWEKAQ